MASAKSRDLNLQRDDEALHSLLQEWMTQLSNRAKTRDQTDRAFAEMSESRTRGSDFSPAVLPPEPCVDSLRVGSPETSIKTKERGDIKDAGSRASIGRRTVRTLIRGLIIAIIVGAGWQVYRDDQTKELFRSWVHSSLVWSLAVLDSTERGSDLTSEPAPKLSDQAVTPSVPTSISINEFPELQQQLQAVARDLATLQRLVEQVASKQEKISRDMTTLQAAEQNIGEKISSVARSAAIRVAQRRNVAKVVHSDVPKPPTAEPLAVQPLTPEPSSPIEQTLRPPLPLSTPSTEPPPAAH
jgi:hypothetical protein